MFSWYSKCNYLNANPTKWSNTLKQFVGNLPTNYLSVFDHFVKLALKESNKIKGARIMDTLKLFYFEVKQITLEKVLFSVLDGTNAMSGSERELRGEYAIIHLSTFT